VLRGVPTCRWIQGAAGNVASLPPHGGSEAWGRCVGALSLGGLLCLSLAGEALALDPRRGIEEYVQDNWETERGLPHSSVMAVLQTRDGYLWLGTHGGLVRFDGVGFALFLKDQHVHALLEGRDGALWVGTWGTGLVRYQHGQFVTYTSRDGLVQDEVRCLQQSRDGALWIGTNGGLSRLQGGAFTSYTTRNGLAHPVVRALHEDRGGTLWIGTHGGGLSSFAGGRFTRHVNAPDLRPDEVIRAIHPAVDGDLWLATERGLKRLREGPGGGGAATIASYTRRQGLADDDVLALHTDRDGQLWIGTRRGLCRFHEGRLATSAAGGGLVDVEIRALFEDREGNLWVGTAASGLTRLKNRAFLSLAKKHGLSADDVRAVYEDRQGAVWIGTHNSGVNRVQGGRISVFRKAQGLPSDRVWSVAEDDAGTLWLGTFGAGLARYVGGRFHVFTTKDGLPSDVVRCLLAGRDGSLWVGTEAGLARLRDGRWERFGPADGLVHPQVLSIHEGADGTLWIGTREGLNRLRGGMLDVPAGGRDLGLVLAIREDLEGTLWLGTRGRGLWRFRDGRWNVYSTADGLPHDTVLHILEDDDGYLWLSSPRGIYRVSRRELADKQTHARAGVTYDRAEGLDTVECNGGFQPAGWRTRDGRLWFPTMKGVAVIDPRRTPVNTVPPSVHIESVRLAGRPVPLGPQPSLAPDNKSLEISYVGLSFAAPEKVRFRYMLEGFDEEWIEAGTRRTAYYTTLPAGSYRFHVKACNDSGYWSEAEAILDLTVRPRFYQTWWFYVAAAVAVLFLVDAEHRLRMWRARKRFGAVLEERTRIARELHDTLAQGLAVVGIQLEALAVHLPSAGGEARHHLEHARRQIRASLVDARQSLWDLRSGRFEAWDLREALDALAQEVTATGVVGAHVHCEASPRGLLPGVKRHLLRIAQEAVSNALKHARAKRVEITLERGAGHVRLSVADDGAGFDPEAASAARFGLAGMRERARLMKATLKIERRAEGGTEVSVCLPLSKDGEEHRHGAGFACSEEERLRPPDRNRPGGGAVRVDERHPGRGR
jgi:ligand-binding sensor domain-containing protein/signal transduction histidine kinase